MKVMIATDGSKFSQAAVNKACDFLGEKTGMEIKVVSAYEEDYAMAAEPFAVSADLYREIAEAAENQARQNALSAAETIKKRLGEVTASITTAILKGNPPQQIVDIAEEWGADLIVVGSHGRGFWGRLLGSVSDGVVHHAPCSVMVVREPAID
mgnify:CR=1 FL=1